jgi:folate-dependent phosphoribosylglycinamide formyltransferase PurN
VTFVPDNYDDFVLAMAVVPQIAGLLVLDNTGWGLRAKALGAALQGAPRLGATLLRNCAWRASERRRQAAYAAAGKGVWVRSSINDPGALRLLREQRFDLVVNARTRFIYGAEALAAPRLGCINVHHGLLPDQRGVMCDLWALAEGEAAGFSVHRMTARVDDGALLRAVPVSRGERDFQTHLRTSAHREAQVLAEVLAELEGRGEITGTPNVKTARTRYRRNPTWGEVRRMRAGGLRL